MPTLKMPLNIEGKRGRNFMRSYPVFSLVLYPDYVFFSLSRRRTGPFQPGSTTLWRMVFILDGCSFNYAHIWSKKGISICGRHLVTSKGSSSPKKNRKRPTLYHTYATCSELPIYTRKYFVWEEGHCHRRNLKEEIGRDKKRRGMGSRTKSFF